MSKAIALTDSSFEEIVLKSDKPVMVDFWATWCGPCRMVSPTLDQVADEFGDKIVFAKANVDETPQLAEKFNIMTIPTVMFFKDGQALSEEIGVKTKALYISKIEAML